MQPVSPISESFAERPVLLTARGVGRAFRGLQALADYEVDLRRGDILGVIGPNGAGKTTLFNVITGFIAPSSGRIMLDGQEIAGMPAERIVRLGIARTFQNIRLFSRMTVLENVMTAQQLRAGEGLAETLLSLPSFLGKERRQREAALAHLERLGLAGFAEQMATSLPYGFQRKLEIARALATEPSVLLLDEPAAGMNAGETAELTGFIRQIQADFGLTVVVVEHDMSLIMRLCERLQVLNYGRIIAEGTPAEIRANPAVIEAYLGDDASVVQHLEALAQAHDERHVVFHHDDRQPEIGLDLPDEPGQLGRLSRVHPGRRLIQQEDGGLRRQGPGNLQLALVPVRQRRRHLLGEPGQPEPLQVRQGRLPLPPLLPEEARERQQRLR